MVVKDILGEDDYGNKCSNLITRCLKFAFILPHQNDELRVIGLVIGQKIIVINTSTFIMLMVIY